MGVFTPYRPPFVDVIKPLTESYFEGLDDLFSIPDVKQFSESADFVGFRDAGGYLMAIYKDKSFRTVGKISVRVAGLKAWNKQEIYET